MEVTRPSESKLLARTEAFKGGACPASPVGLYAPSVTRVPGHTVTIPHARKGMLRHNDDGNAVIMMTCTASPSAAATATTPSLSMSGDRRRQQPSFLSFCNDAVSYRVRLFSNRRRLRAGVIYRSAYLITGLPIQHYESVVEL